MVGSGVTVHESNFKITFQSILTRVHGLSMPEIRQYGTKMVTAPKPNILRIQMVRHQLAIPRGDQEKPSLKLEYQGQ